MAKATDKAKKPGRFAQLLRRRVDAPVGKTLGKDVTTPKPVKAASGYFKGSWEELRQVKWPTRRASWGLTFAVIMFTLAMVALILLLDYGFEQLFKQVILG